MQINKTACLCLFLLFSLNAFSQKLFEDAEGESSVTLPQVSFGQLRINSGSTSFSVSAGRVREAGMDAIKGKKLPFNWVLQGSVAVDLSEGIGKILADKKFTPKVKASLLGGMHFPKIKDKDQFINVFLGYTFSYSESKVLNLPADSILRNKKDHYNDVALNINGYHNFWQDKFLLFWGTKLGVGYKSNNDDLTDITSDTLLATIQGISYRKTDKLKLGDFKHAMIYPVRFDLAFIPNGKNLRNVLGFNFYYKCGVAKQTKMDVGVGVFAIKSGKSGGKKFTNVVGGLAWQMNDVSNIANSTESTFARSTLFFYVGYNFGVGNQQTP